MNNGLVTLPLVCSLSLLSGCAYFKSASIEPWSIKPTVVVRHTTENPDAMYQMGRYYQGQMRYDLAINAYRKALNADKHYADAYNGLGVVYWLQGRQAEAVIEFENAVRYAPVTARFQNNLGYAYYLQGRYDDAVAILEKSATLEPHNPQIRDNLKMAYAKAGLEAVGSSRLVSTVPSPATAYLQTRQKEESLKLQAAAAPSVAAVSHADDVSTGHEIPLVENPLEAVQTAANIYELRLRKTDAIAVNPNSPEAQAEGEKPVQALAVASEQQFPIEVANGNGTTGLARKVGQYLKEQGYGTARLTNQKPYVVRATLIQYRDGYADQAKRLQASIWDSSAMVQSNRIKAGVAVRVVLGKDLPQERLAKMMESPGYSALALDASGSEKRRN